MDEVPLESLARILDVAEDGIVTVTADYRIVLFNRGATKLFGYQPSEVLGQSLDMLIPPAYHITHREEFRRFAEGPIISRMMGERKTVVGLRKDGSQFPVEITISKLDSPAGPLLTAIIRNAEERKRYENALLRLNQELEERVKSRTAELAERNLQLMQKTEENELFVYSVSHDLRSPLINLEGFSEELLLSARELEKLLTDSRVPSDVRERALMLIGHEGMQESIRFIRAAVGRLGRIIDALLRLSRAGRVEYSLQIVDVANLVERITDTLQGMLQEKKAELIVGVLPPAWGDPNAVEQVFANLMTNALMYLDPSRPGKIEVGALGTDEGQVKYFVRDNGVGIAPVNLPKVFQAFQRLHANAPPGEGIGLAICRRVLERLGGSISVESTLGTGTTFYVTLPSVPPRSATKSQEA